MEELGGWVEIGLAELQTHERGITEPKPFIDIEERSCKPLREMAEPQYSCGLRCFAPLICSDFGPPPRFPLPRCGLKSDRIAVDIDRDRSDDLFHAMEATVCRLQTAKDLQAGTTGKTGTVGAI